MSETDLGPLVVLKEQKSTGDEGLKVKTGLGSVEGSHK